MTGPREWPERIAIDAHGYGWRVWDDEMWSMVPTNPDNSPISHPVTWFVRVELTEDEQRSLTLARTLCSEGRKGTVTIGRWLLDDLVNALDRVAHLPEWTAEGMDADVCPGVPRRLVPADREREGS